MNNFINRHEWLIKTYNYTEIINSMIVEYIYAFAERVRTTNSYITNIYYKIKNKEIYYKSYKYKLINLSK